MSLAGIVTVPVSLFTCKAFTVLPEASLMEMVRGAAVFVNERLFGHQ